MQTTDNSVFNGGLNFMSRMGFEIRQVSQNCRSPKICRYVCKRI